MFTPHTAQARLNGSMPMGFFVKFIASVCFLGHLPVMPGTFGAAAGLAVFLAAGSVRGTAAALVIALAAGFLFSGEAERLYGEKDSRFIVIDEVAGMLLGLLFVPRDPVLALIGFLMFRIFDTLKPFPAGRLQDLKGAAGIMMDDVVAGLYTLFVMQVIIRLI